MVLSVTYVSLRKSNDERNGCGPLFVFLVVHSTTLSDFELCRLQRPMEQILLQDEWGKYLFGSGCKYRNRDS